jgi:Ca2+-transporting ATPase
MIQKASDPQHLEKVLKLVHTSFNVNATAADSTTRDGSVKLTGSKTEIAILELAKTFGYPYQADRAATNVLQMKPFNSQKKCMVTFVRLATSAQFEEQMGLTESERAGSAAERDWCFVKGASEIILSRCNRYLAESGRVEPITDEIRQYFLSVISSAAENALRTIGASVKPIHNYVPLKRGEHAKEEEEDKMDHIFVALFGILDPLRPEVPDAVRLCQKAGIVVRMVTGDNLITAKAIARNCGILSADGLSMEGPEFRKLTDEQRTQILPRLQVLARSSPMDKQILVNGLKRMGETVAVTGGRRDSMNCRALF